jgi:hypothetical protein
MEIIKPVIKIYNKIIQEKYCLVKINLDNSFKKFKRSKIKLIPFLEHDYFFNFYFIHSLFKIKQYI